MVTDYSFPGVPPPPYKLDPEVEPKLDPEYVQFFNKHMTEAANLLFTNLIPVDVLRAGGNVMPGQSPLSKNVVITDDKVIPQPKLKTSCTDPIPIRIFTPKDKPVPEGGWPVFIWFHGGGWVLGNITTENSFCSHICELSQCVVISVDYRLAPEHVFPACIDDSLEAVVNVLENPAKYNVNANKLAFGGSSAGGNITAVLAHILANPEDSRFTHLPAPVFQVLCVPVCDNTASPKTHKSWKEFQNTPQLPAAKMMWYRELYLPNKEDWANPVASPHFYPAESFKRVCPALICAAACDILSTEAEIYAEQLSSAGVPVDLKIYPGVPHPVMAMDDVLTQANVLKKDVSSSLYNVFYK